VSLLVNSTVLSNFAGVGHLDLLRQAVEGRAGTTEAVVAEFTAGAELGYFPADPLAWLPRVHMTDDDAIAYERLRRHLAAGEASCLAIAEHRHMRVATDDGDARRYARRTGIAVSGTLGILVHLVVAGAISRGQASDLLRQMIHLGYRSPVADIDELMPD